MNGMEFTWQMVSALAWPVVAIVGVFAFREWITDKVGDFGISVGSIRVHFKALNTKVDTVGKDIAITLSDHMPQPVDPEAIPKSLVDLMATINRNRMEGIDAAFNLVQKALKEHYPPLRRYLPSQLPEAMGRLVDRGEMEPDVALSVSQLYELQVMPEWRKDQAGDTRGYAFLMLAEGAIHGILRSARARSTGTGQIPPASGPAVIAGSWHGIYDGRFLIDLDINTRSGPAFTGTMTYPDADGDTVTNIVGTVKNDTDGSVRLEWNEKPPYRREGRRPIDFEGDYAATIRGDAMDGAWYKADRRVASFTMTATGSGASAAAGTEPRDHSR